MTSWIDCGVLAWMGEDRYGEDETVLVYFKGSAWRPWLLDRSTITVDRALMAPYFWTARPSATG
ncbi:hypothetical protein ACFOSC_10775 [Streptantibioticus rubrisoli]|uniref:Uncharacterized protein n=1 Tax=Streptantibioticus rubrisoli TaxID=1387313 RepID=A0ABT1PBP6_9ACTN|nr:hypothetical protein [Streptantibioticus rubrisoli]MCQ4042787.1 hypothetical protein [Streptantibioticus rubrisoli]